MTVPVEGVTDGDASPPGDPIAPAAYTDTSGATTKSELAVAARNALKVGGSLLLTWSVAMIIKLQVPAHLGPVRQGHFGFAESFAGLFFVFLGLGVDTYVMKEIPVRPKHASDFVGGVFALRGLLALVMFVAMGITLWVTGRTPEVQLTVVVFGAAQLLMTYNGTLATTLLAATHVDGLAVANVAAKVAWGGGLLLGLHFNVPLYVLALPFIVSELVRTAVLLPATRKSIGLEYRIDLPQVKVVLIASIPFFVSAVAVGMGNNLAMSALGFMRNDEREVGWFAATQNLATLAMLLSPVLSGIVMPLLSRAHARSEDEMMVILRRGIEGLVIVIAPITVIISVCSDVFVKLAFGERYAPAATGLAVLSLVFVVTYINMILSMALIVVGRSWSVTLISLTGIASMIGFMFVFVPLGRAMFHVGGECAGAAMAVIANELCVVVALISRFRTRPIDGRNVAALLKSAAAGMAVAFVDHVLRGRGFGLPQGRALGLSRVVVDCLAYVALAMAIGIVRIDDLRRAYRLLRARDPKGNPSAEDVASAAAVRPGDGTP